LTYLSVFPDGGLPLVGDLFLLLLIGFLARELLLDGLIQGLCEQVLRLEQKEAGKKNTR
jgi:hypothetical protein